MVLFRIFCGVFLFCCFQFGFENVGVGLYGGGDHSGDVYEAGRVLCRERGFSGAQGVFQGCFVGAEVVFERPFSGFGL